MLDNYVKICKTGENTSEVIVESDPAGTQHQNDVVSTSMRRDHVASTLIRRHFNVVCLLGKAQISCASGYEGTDQPAHPLTGSRRPKSHTKLLDTEDYSTL